MLCVCARAFVAQHYKRYNCIHKAYSKFFPIFYIIYLIFFLFVFYFVRTQSLQCFFFFFCVVCWWGVQQYVFSLHSQKICGMYIFLGFRAIEISNIHKMCAAVALHDTRPEHIFYYNKLNIQSFLFLLVLLDCSQIVSDCFLFATTLLRWKENAKSYIFDKNNVCGMGGEGGESWMCCAYAAHSL